MAFNLYLADREQVYAERVAQQRREASQIRRWAARHGLVENQEDVYKRQGREERAFWRKPSPPFPHTPIPPLPKTFDGWGGHATGVRSNLKFFKGRAKQVPFPVALETDNP